MSDEREHHLEMMEQVADGYCDVAAATMDEEEFKDAVDVRLDREIEINVEVKFSHLINAMNHLAIDIHETDDTTKSASLAKLYVSLFDSIPEEEHELLEEMKREPGIGGIAGVGFQ